MVEPNSGGGGNRTRDSFQPGGTAWNDLTTAAPDLDHHPCCAVLPDGRQCPHPAGPVGRFLWLCWRHERRLASEMLGEMLAEINADSGWVYFAVRHDRPGLVKIGFTTDPIKRMTTLGAQPLVIMPFATRSDEAALHREFADYRVDGEWFRLEGPVQDRINEHLALQMGWAS